MARLATVGVNTLDIERVAENLRNASLEQLRASALRAVNTVAQRGFKTTVTTITERSALKQPYIEERMGVEPATDARKPEAVIVAFRYKGTRRPALSGVNLRQYEPVVEIVPVRYPNASNTGKRFVMKDGRAAKKPWSDNPRKPGGKLPFVVRTGNTMLGIPVDKKAGNLSVEVQRGQRKVVKPINGYKPFMQRMKNGETLVMVRTGKTNSKGKSKGAMRSVSSLSVWQLFRSNMAKIIPLVAKDLEQTVGDEVVAELARKITTV